MVSVRCYATMLVAVILHGFASPDHFPNPYDLPWVIVGSGTVTILEAYRALLAANYTPIHDVEFHWYSAVRSFPRLISHFVAPLTWETPCSVFYVTGRRRPPRFPGCCD